MLNTMTGSHNFHPRILKGTCISNLHVFLPLFFPCFEKELDSITINKCFLLHSNKLNFQ